VGEGLETAKENNQGRDATEATWPPGLEKKEMKSSESKSKSDRGGQYQEENEFMIHQKKSKKHNKKKITRAAIGKYLTSRKAKKQGGSQDNWPLFDAGKKLTGVGLQTTLKGGRRGGKGKELADGESEKLPSKGRPIGHGCQQLAGTKEKKKRTHQGVWGCKVQKNSSHATPKGW